MSLPASVRAAVTDVLRSRGRSAAGTEVTRVASVAGGCINHGARVETAGGESFFLKWNPDAPSGMFDAEADGLAALARASGEIPESIRPRVPQPLALADADGGTPAWFLMEWIPPGRQGGDSADERLGRGLAHLHSLEPEPPVNSWGSSGPSGRSDDATRASDDHDFGWARNNWIGSLPQANDRTASWADFWRDRRIIPQLRMARRTGHLRGSLLDDLVAVIPQALDGVESPSLLHGDLWSGNSYVADDGRSTLVDPAVYGGDGEVDLAMTELFGGFGSSFYDGYDDVRPITLEYGSHRRALYQLYYLLVHVNLFGGSYEAGCRRAAETVLAAVG